MEFKEEMKALYVAEKLLFKIFVKQKIREFEGKAYLPFEEIPIFIIDEIRKNKDLLGLSDDITNRLIVLIDLRGQMYVERFLVRREDIWQLI